MEVSPKLKKILLRMLVFDTTLVCRQNIWDFLVCCHSGKLFLAFENLICQANMENQANFKLHYNVCEHLRKEIRKHSSFNSNVWKFTEKRLRVENRKNQVSGSTIL